MGQAQSTTTVAPTAAPSSQPPSASAAFPEPPLRTAVHAHSGVVALPKAALSDGGNAFTPRSLPAAPPPTPAVHATQDVMSGMERMSISSPIDPSLAASMAGPSHHVPPSTPAVAGMPAVDPPHALYMSPPSTPPKHHSPPAATDAAQQQQLGQQLPAATLVGPQTPTPIASHTSASVTAAPNTMKAWVLRKRGSGAADEAALTCEAAWPVVAPGRGQIRVRVICAALNPVDGKKISSIPNVELPCVLGCDGSGVVESLGEEDPTSPFTVAPGDRVYFHNYLVRAAQGTFAEYTVCDAAAVSRIADNVSFADAAAVPCAGWTAFVGLFDKLKLQPGATLLVLGASGGVGSFAVSLAKLCGCRIIATCRGSSAAYVKGLGADVVIDREQAIGRIQDTLKGYAPIDAAFDASGACSDEALLSVVAGVLKFGAGLCSVLPLSTSVDTERTLMSRQISRHYVNLGGHHEDRARQKVLQAVGDSVMQLLSVGVPDPASASGTTVKRLPSHLTELIQFSHVRQGLVTLAGGATKGKIVMSFAIPAVAKKAPAAW